MALFVCTVWIEYAKTEIPDAAVYLPLRQISQVSFKKALLAKEQKLPGYGTLFFIAFKVILPGKATYLPGYGIFIFLIFFFYFIFFEKGSHVKLVMEN